MKSTVRTRVLLLAALLALAACRPAAPPATPEPMPTATTTAAAPTVPTVAPPTPTASAAAAEPAGLDISPADIRLDTQGLPYSWQPVVVPLQPYDASSPPGPTGMPEHIEILFGVTDPKDRQPNDPVMYIIPVDAYRQLWSDAGNDSVAKTIDLIFQFTVALQNPPPTSDFPVLPYEFGGVNDLAVQQGRVPAGAASASINGYRFVGRWAQDANPVTNQGLHYVYQGFTNDGKYLVSFFYPVRTDELPDEVSQVPADEMQQFNADPAAAIQAKAVELNQLATSDWEPDLATLDKLVASLQIAGMPANGLVNNVWHAVSRNDKPGGEEQPIPDPSKYSLTFLSDGTLNYVADCNIGIGRYAVTGAVTGGIAIDLGPTTLAACGSESLGTDLTNLLNATQNFKVHPGGEKLELILPAGGGSWFFEFAGPADTQQPPPELVPTVAVPTPAPQAPTGRVTAPAGVNVRTGPSTSYPVLGVAPFGATGEIIGRSADGQWWVARVPSAPTGQGWVSAAYVIATGADNVPVIPAPPLPPTATPAPNPTATPVPQATSTPMPEIAFWADRYDIPLGECTNLRWQVQNVSGVWVYPQGQPYQNFPQTGVSAQQVCPTATTTYEMRVLLNNGAVELRQLTINVSAVNPLANTNWALSSFTPGRVPLPNTSITLAFAANNTLSGNAGCNTYNGGYTVSGNNLRVSGVTTTLKTCGEEIDGQERQYLQALQSAAFFELSGSQLIVRDASGQEVLRFNRIG